MRMMNSHQFRTLLKKQRSPPPSQGRKPFSFSDTDDHFLSSNKWTKILAILTLLVLFLYLLTNSISSSRGSSQATFRIVSPKHGNDDKSWSRFSSMLDSVSPSEVSHETYTPEEQRNFLQRHGKFCYHTNTAVLERYDELPNDSLKEQLFKYCILYTGRANIFWDVSDVVLLQPLSEFLHLLQQNSAAIVVDTENLREEENTEQETLIHSSFLFVSSKAPPVAKSMIQLLVETSNQVLASSPLLLARQLSLYMEDDKAWAAWQSLCRDLADAAGGKQATSGERIDVAGDRHAAPSVLHMQQNSQVSLIATSVTPLSQTRRLHQTCPIRGGYCCHVPHPEGGSALMALKNPVGVNLQGQTRDPPMPYSTVQRHSLVGVPAPDVPYISTIREVQVLPSTQRSDQQNSVTRTPNFFDILFTNDCLPTQKACHKCLKSTRNGQGSCQNCMKVCPCYCSILCKVRPPEKRIVKEYHVFPPQYRKDPQRLVPRIIHQTWYEPVSKETYPNMSRLVESWKKSGWEYNFYNDDTAAEFLSAHFPPEVREAYDAIIPGAFKADLFRYCVLLIRGGVYADMDVLLQSNLDDVISGDVGFMVPIDEPGINVGHRSCLWNGLLAVAPGHPFLAKTIEIVVNNIRNRFTSVDYDDMLCPNPVLIVSHNVDMLFTCGPCILGAGMNDVLKRHMQHQFEIGEVDIWANERSETHSDRIVVEPDDPRLAIPGRSIILHQNKKDMGAHRFTWADRNIVVAATDMPDYDDRPPTKEHYSKTHEKEGIYGLQKLYRNNKRANEKIIIRVQP